MLRSNCLDVVLTLTQVKEITSNKILISKNVFIFSSKQNCVISKINALLHYYLFAIDNVIVSVIVPANTVVSTAASSKILYVHPTDASFGLAYTTVIGLDNDESSSIKLSSPTDIVPAGVPLVQVSEAAPPLEECEIP
jgi:hypothetical protein